MNTTEMTDGLVETHRGQHIHRRGERFFVAEIVPYREVATIEAARHAANDWLAGLGVRRRRQGAAA